MPTQAQALRHQYPNFHILVRQELAKLAAAGATSHAKPVASSDGRRWPTPAVVKALLASYETTVHRFPTFLRCLEAKPAAAGQKEGGGASGGGGAGAGKPRRLRDADEGWETSRVNFGTSGWRLLDEDGDGAQQGGKKHK